MRLKLALVLILAMPALAIAEDSRYQLEKIDGAIVRLDRQTGMIATCAMESGQMVCRSAPDEIAAYESAMTGLEERIAKLEQDLAKLKSVPPQTPSAELPTDEEFERTLGFMEKFFRRFKDIIRDLDSGGTTGKVPERT